MYIYMCKCIYIYIYISLSLSHEGLRAQGFNHGVLGSEVSHAEFMARASDIVFLASLGPRVGL